MRLLTGAGRYVDDVHLDGMLHAAVFRSSWPHGRIRSVDIAAAAAMPGVIGVFTPLESRGAPEADPPANCRDARLREFPSAAPRHRQGPVCRRAHRGRGRDQPLRRGGRRCTDFGRDRGPAADSELGQQQTTARSWCTKAPGRTRPASKLARGNADAAFKTAYYVRRERFTVQRHTAVPMEARGLAAVWDADEQRMTVFGITKVPFFNRSLLASMLELPQSSVVMKVADAGGGFGVRGEFYPEDFLIPAIARSARSPGEMDRGPARAFPCDQPCPRNNLRPGNRLRPGRHHSRVARRGHGRYRRLCPRHGRHVTDALRAIPARAVSDSELCLQGQRPCLEQDAIGNLPRSRTGRGEFLPRALDRHRSRRSRH